MSETVKTFNVDAFLDARRIGAMHIRIVALLMFVMLLDGYDLYIVGLLLPVLAKSWHLAPTAFTAVFVAQQAGLIIGLFTLGPLSDRIGRKAILTTCLLGFAICTLLVPFCHSPLELSVLRFVSGLFFSAVGPNCIALASEIAPERSRSSFITIVFFGYAGGILLAASTLAFIVEPFGWQGGFYIGAAVPLLLAPILYLFLPESIKFRVTANPRDPRIAKMLRRVDPKLSFDGNETFVLNDTAKLEKFAPIALFRGGYLKITLLIWLAFALLYVLNQMVSSWDSTVLTHYAKLELKHVALLISVQTTAAMVGTLTVGLVMDRFGAIRTLISLFVIAASLYASLGWVDLAAASTIGIFALLGYTASSALSGMNAQTIVMYPPRFRVTGYAWASGVGRIGGLLGPILGGALLASGQHTIVAFFSIAALTELLGGLTIGLLVWTVRKKQLA